jgi:hypothetical protein
VRSSPIVLHVAELLRLVKALPVTWSRTGRFRTGLGGCCGRGPSQRPLPQGPGIARQREGREALRLEPIRFGFRFRFVFSGFLTHTTPPVGRRTKPAFGRRLVFGLYLEITAQRSAFLPSDEEGAKETNPCTITIHRIIVHKLRSGRKKEVWKTKRRPRLEFVAPFCLLLIDTTRKSYGEGSCVLLSLPGASGWWLLSGRLSAWARM